jgi:tetraacyldisaccharide 4'-kinase
VLDNVLRVPRLDIALPPQDWRRARFMVFSAIGNPAAFLADLRKWEFQVVGERSYADHHVYTEHEIAELEQAATKCGGDALLCTEKDVWNLRHVPLTGIPVYCCRISLQLPEEFQAALEQLIALHAGAER